jgi:ATP-dependent RNA helicase DDX24/MAK5
MLVLLIGPTPRAESILQDDRLTEEIKDLKFLVLDEADRMVEAGHFAELDNILRLTLRPPRLV